MEGAQIKVLWRGDWKDGVIAIFCAEEDKEAKVIHFRIDAQDGTWVCGQVEFGIPVFTKSDLQERVESILVSAEATYMEYLMQQRENWIRDYGIEIH